MLCYVMLRCVYHPWVSDDERFFYMYLKQKSVTHVRTLNECLQACYLHVMNHIFHWSPLVKKSQTNAKSQYYMLIVCVAINCCNSTFFR